MSARNSLGPSNPFHPFHCRRDHIIERRLLCLDAARDLEGVIATGDHVQLRSLQRWHARRVAIREASRQPVQEEVDRSCRPRSRGRGACRLCHFQHPMAAAEATGEDRRCERLRVVRTNKVAGESAEECLTRLGTDAIVTALRQG